MISKKAIPGEPVPVIENDETTNERKWFTLTEYEKNFFDVRLLSSLAFQISYYQ
jgi:hypothetical protein